MLLLPEQMVDGYQSFLLSSSYLGWIGIFIAWQVFDYFFDPVFGFSLNLLYFFFGASYG